MQSPWWHLRLATVLPSAEENNQASCTSLAVPACGRCARQNAHSPCSRPLSSPATSGSITHFRVPVFQTSRPTSVIDNDPLAQVPSSWAVYFRQATLRQKYQATLRLSKQLKENLQVLGSNTFILQMGNRNAKRSAYQGDGLLQTS